MPTRHNSLFVKDETGSSGRVSQRSTHEKDAATSPVTPRCSASNITNSSPRSSSYDDAEHEVDTSGHGNNTGVGIYDSGNAVHEEEQVNLARAFGFARSDGLGKAENFVENIEPSLQNRHWLTRQHSSSMNSTGEDIQGHVQHTYPSPHQAVFGPTPLLKPVSPHMNLSVQHPNFSINSHEASAHFRSEYARGRGDHPHGDIYYQNFAGGPVGATRNSTGGIEDFNHHQYIYPSAHSAGDSQQYESEYASVSTPSPNVTAMTSQPAAPSFEHLRLPNSHHMSAQKVRKAQPKRRRGAMDPDNIAIVELYDNRKWSFAEISTHLNDEYRKNGKQLTFTTNSVHNRYNRAAPVIYKADGRAFVPIKDRRNWTQTERDGLSQAPSMQWNADMDRLLLNTEETYQNNRWLWVAQKFNEATGHTLSGTAVATRFGMLKP